MARFLAPPAAKLLSFAVIAATLLATLTVSDAKKPPPLTLTLTASKTTYGVDEPLGLRLVLTNRSAEQATVTPSEFGTVRIVKLRRDGKTVKPSIWKEVTVTESPSLTAAAQLRTISPGESLLVAWTATTADTLRAYVVSGRKIKLAAYDVTSPGTYELTVAYKYSGARTPDRAIYRKKLTSNMLTFVRE